MRTASTEPSPRPPTPQAVAICGAGHSGSTLLGMVLGSHSQVFYAGEAKKSRFVGDERKPLRKRVCKICGPPCPVWGRYEQEVRAGGSSLAPYERLRRLTGRPVIVDSTKDIGWIRERAEEAAQAGIAHRLLFLVRDGRAVVNSRVRKYPERDPAALVDEWIAQIRATEALVAERPDDALRVRYEELATEPEPTTRRVCEFLGLAFEPRMLQYETAEQHPLGGNTGAQSVVARASDVDAPLARVPGRSRGYYGGLQGGFRLDLRWRDELPDVVRALFEARAGALNQPFRWEGGER